MKTRHIPLRTCVVCRESSAKKTLLRVVRTKDDAGVQTVRTDSTGKANGRGAYVCKTVECIEKAIKQKRFERSLSATIVSEDLLSELLGFVVDLSNP